MRVLFFTASAIAACLASLGQAVKLEEPLYESYSQVNVFHDEEAAEQEKVRELSQPCHAKERGDQRDMKGLEQLIKTMKPHRENATGEVASCEASQRIEQAAMMGNIAVQ